MRHPAVAVDSLLSGLETITPETGAVVGAVVEEIMAGLERAWSLPRDAVRQSYYHETVFSPSIVKLGRQRVVAGDVLEGCGSPGSPRPFRSKDVPLTKSAKSQS